jgi:hypothetical protein
MNSVLRGVGKELSMKAMRRAIVPVLLAIVGVAAIVEGVRYHSIAVLIEEEKQVTIDVPVLLPPGLPMGGPPLPDGSAMPEVPFGGPTSVKRTITQTDLVAHLISEPELTRDVSVGGVVRETSGEYAGKLKRTYSGKGPALCPT